MKTGRPLSYTPQHLEKALDYLENWKALGDVIPQVASLAVHCDIGITALYQWIKRPELAEFAKVHARVMAQQQIELINKGLDRTHDVSLSKLLLNKHGFSDRQEIDHTSGGEKLSTQPSTEQLATAKADILASLKKS